MASLLEDLGTFLKTKSHIVGDGVDYFRDTLPDTPDQVVACYLYGGSNSNYGDASMLASIQVNVRDVTYAKARKLAYQIYADLQPNADTEAPIIELITGRYAIIEILQPPFKTDLDAQNRTVFTFNMDVRTNKDIE